MVGQRTAGPVVAVVGGVAGFAVGGPLVAAAVALAAVALLAAAHSRRADRRAAERRAVTEGLIDALAAELGSGAAPTAAVAAVLPDLPPAARIEGEAGLHAPRFRGGAVAGLPQARTLLRAPPLPAGLFVCVGSRGRF